MGQKRTYVALCEQAHSDLNDLAVRFWDLGARHVMTGKIFINYRRDDSIGMAGRLHDRLAQVFGRENIFMDVDNIPVGEDFVAHLNNQVAACDVVLAVIGPAWLKKDKSGRRRLNEPGDWVAIEIAAALTRNIRVIPILVDGARMPRESDLPDSVRPLARRQAAEVRHAHFGKDAEALVERMREALAADAKLRKAAAAPAAPKPPETFAADTKLHQALAADSTGANLHQALVGDPVAPRPRSWRWTVAAGAVALPTILLLAWIGFSWKSPPQPNARSVNETVVATAKPQVGVAEQQRQALAMAEQERQARTAAEAEAKRKANEAEQQRQALAKAEQERQAREAAAFDRGRADASKGDYDRAIANFNEAIQLNPRNALVFFSRGIVYAKKRDYDRAITDFSEVIRLDPKDAVAFRNRGDAYSSKRDDDRAIADYNQAIQLNPKDAVAFRDRGNSYSAKNDNDRAMADFNRAIQLDPTSAIGFSYRGVGYLNKGDNDRAIADFNQAIQLDPTIAHPFRNRALVYQKKGDFTRAIADFNEAIRLDPNNAVGFCNRGRLKLRIKDGSGDADIAKARQLDPSVC
jgi:tetratricopeptide (TPR) repeat protein